LQTSFLEKEVKFLYKLTAAVLLLHVCNVAFHWIIVTFTWLLSINEKKLTFF
jgi:hypothetical protein